MPRNAITQARTSVPKAQNKNQYSNAISNAYFNKINLTVTDDTTPTPNGGLADTLTATATGGFCYFTRTIASSIVGNYLTIAMWVKKGTSRYVWLLGGGSDRFCIFDLQTGTFSSFVNAPQNSVANIVAEDDGYRIYFAFLINAFNQNIGLGLTNSATVANASVTGETVIAGEVQTVEGNWPGQFVPTEGAVVNTGAIRSTIHAPQNEITYSEQLDHASWGKYGATVTPNTTNGPDGILKADTITSTTTGGYSYVAKGATVPLGTFYTVSGWVNKGTSRYCWLLGGASTQFAIFDLDTGLFKTYFGPVTGETVTHSIEPREGGYDISFTLRAFTTTPVIGIGMTNSPSAPNFSVTGETVIATELQLNNKNWPGTYSKTEATIIDQGGQRNILLTTRTSI